MRKLMFVSLLCFVQFFLHAQKLTREQVPLVLSNKLVTDFPNAEHVKWEKKKDHYKVEFEVGKMSHDIWMSAEGKVSKHRSEWKKSELPAPILATIKKGFSTYTIGDCEKTEELTTVSYKVELKSETGKKNVHFTPEGKMIPKKE